MELARFPSRGGFSLRSIFTFVLAVIATVLLGAILLSSSPVQAAPEASWNGDSIIYDTRQYNEIDSSKIDKSHGIPENSTIFIYRDASNVSASSRKAYILYFTPGVDPPTASSVEFVEFDYSSSGIFSNPQNKKTITITPKGEEEELSSCSVSGVGWVICPVSIWLADGMDWLFDQLANLISVQPTMLGDTDSALYTAWSVMRSIANIAFLIVFIIIIYSQLTNLGVSNYGIKRLMPRLVIAALLVNLSFIITAIAIDASNIIGYSLQDVLSSIRQDLFAVTNDTWGGTVNWGVLTSIILGGGALGYAAIGSAGGAVYLLVPLLVGLAGILIFVLLILAARQAIIIILVVISPLAFVAYLLPNTEKYFDKWRGLFMTMLIFFPAFSLVFGGAQLAGQIILQNAGDNIVLVLFGLAVQVAPLVITPLLLKLSGGLLGKIAQIANNPRKGYLDRSKNWANERVDLKRQQNLGKDFGSFKDNWWKANQWGARSLQKMDNSNRRVKGATELAKLRADNRYNNTRGYMKIHEDMHDATMDKELLETQHKEHIQAQTNTIRGRYYAKNLHLEAAKRSLEKSIKIGEANIKEFENGKIRSLDGQFIDADSGILDAQLTAAVQRIQASRQSITIESMRGAKADEQLQRTLADALSNSIELRTRAGGIREGGVDSVLAAATVAVQKANAEDIKNIQDASGLKPGDLDGAAKMLTEAVQEGNSIRARAFQNMLVTAGGAGMDKFTQTMIKLGTTVPADVAYDMRDNLLSNHGALKAKANHLIDWAAKGGTLQERVEDTGAWAGLSVEDFALQHATSQAWALDAGAVDKARAIAILDDPILNKKITPKILQRLSDIAERPYPPEDAS